MSIVVVQDGGHILDFAFALSLESELLAEVAPSVMAVIEKPHRGWERGDDRDSTPSSMPSEERSGEKRREEDKREEGKGLRLGAARRQ